MTVSEIRKAMNKVASVSIRVDFIEDSGPVDLKVPKTEMRKVLKDFARADEIDAFGEGEILIVNQAFLVDDTEDFTDDLDVDEDIEESESLDEALSSLS